MFHTNHTRMSHVKSNQIGIQKESKETALLRVSFNAYDDDGSGFIGVLQCAAVCCSVLQCVLVCCSELYCYTYTYLSARSCVY